MMKKTFIIGWILAVLLMASCGGRKFGSDFYETMIDSMRKAEQLKEMKQNAGIYDDPVEAYFDTLQLCPLPIRSSGVDVNHTMRFSDAPASVVQWLGYPLDQEMQMVSLPSTHGFRVIVLSEEQKDLPPILTLMTLDKLCQPVDRITLYEQRTEEHGDDFGLIYNDYYITSDYEITLVYAFVRQTSDLPQVESTRRYIINAEGHFEEQVVDM